ncbi:hypothetical protein BGX26_010960 [Mortierella sp. AD094]|nr:hypothetical protein BGX26_010960 [Mortierella sp. AD094]
MLAKSLCLSVSAVSHVFSWMPPSTSSSTSSRKDKVGENQFYKKYGYHIIPYFVGAMGVLQAGIYIYFISGGLDEKDSKSAAMSRFKTLEGWQLICTVVCLLTAAYRRWSYITLDRFFTYQVSISAGHRLIGTGPYKYLLHPSYMCLFVNYLFFYLLLWVDGLWGMAMESVVRLFALILPSKSLIITVNTVGSSSDQLAPMWAWTLSAPTSLPHSFLGIDFGLLIAGYLSMKLLIFLVNRINNEEKLLRAHFGGEWDRHASQRWRMFPLIY